MRFMAMKRFLAAIVLSGCLGLVTGCEDSKPDPAASKKAIDDMSAKNAEMMKQSAGTIKDKSGAEKAVEGAKADNDKAGDDEKAKEE
jgi:hypothetical protein